MSKHQVSCVYYTGLRLRATYRTLLDAEDTSVHCTLSLLFLSPHLLYIQDLFEPEFFVAYGSAKYPQNTNNNIQVYTVGISVVTVNLKLKLLQMIFINWNKVK